jgi:integrase/recombinase XerD
MAEQTAQLQASDVGLITEFLDQLWLDKGVSEHTLSAYGTDLRKFALFLAQQKKNLLDADSQLLNRYLAQRIDKAFSPRSTSRALSSLRRFYAYVHQSGKIARNPLSQLLNPKIGRSLPKTLSEQDVDALLSAPDINDPIQFRDKAMLELLYASGLRVSELVGLSMQQINLHHGLVRVTGKGQKERLVPMGEEAPKA